MCKVIWAEMFNIVLKASWECNYSGIHPWFVLHSSLVCMRFIRSLYDTYSKYINKNSRTHVVRMRLMILKFYSENHHCASSTTLSTADKIPSGFLPPAGAK